MILSISPFLEEDDGPNFVCLSPSLSRSSYPFLVGGYIRQWWDEMTISCPQRELRKTCILYYSSSIREGYHIVAYIDALKKLKGPIIIWNFSKVIISQHFFLAGMPN
jgi:hypothetical protein